MAYHLLAPVTRETYGFAIRKGAPEFLTWLNLFIEQIKSDGTMDLLTYEYFEQMSWPCLPLTPDATMTRAALLKNNSVARHKALLEKRRQQRQTAGAAYE